MSLETLLEKIGDDARIEGSGLVADAKQEAKMIKDKASKQARESAKEIRDFYREKGERQRTKIMSEALAESRAAFLAAQDTLFEEVFTEAIKSFENLPEQRYRQWLKRTIMENVTGGKERIIAPAHDRGLLEEGLLDEIKEAITEKGGKASLVLDREKARFSRGVILKSKDFINNLSLKSLMREVRDRHEEEVLRMLFGEVDVRGAAR
ncbi:MAG: hypothetical protein A2V52_02405 [Actinobacteria bacterium RBG_19FT_COMBO_54_7]|uniref:Uncharacterized protein n=1 Tax=Candidatus Solincola sediminis TaxID=1797199 RepID=A0A1F2WGI0_9ACTN|nr:MAG: hypothetical protein A2Y75_04440 [Candidatus Solincola sediminis]OFW56259.1 MAG: hypothetical protein A2W01_05905 [Candidatus Solincola sediminis]OFW68990.1 MAG: hypothetical protein A2V52_02405 [Actinobacteria bacterium RBG_19FT_COMBO_54_7]